MRLHCMQAAAGAGAKKRLTLVGHPHPHPHPIVHEVVIAKKKKKSLSHQPVGRALLYLLVVLWRVGSAAHSKGRHRILVPKMQEG